MKSLTKLLVSLLLVLAVVFNIAACDVITNIPGINFGSDSPSTNTDGEQTGDKEQPSDTPSDGDNSDDNTSDGDNSDDNTSDNNTSDGNISDDNTSDGNTSDGNTSDNNTSDGNISDDNTSDDNTGETPDPPIGGDDPDDGADDEYVFGSEYADVIIPVSAALDKAQEYTSSASNDTYYILVTIDNIVNLKSGNMYVSDDTGSIYIYKATNNDGSSLSTTDIAVGDVAVIAGPLRNYKGELEIEKGKVLAFYTPGVDTPTKPDEKPDDGTDTPSDNIGSGTDTPSDDVPTVDIVWPTPDDPITSDPYANVDKEAFYADYRPAVSYMDAYYRTLHNLMSGSIEAQDQAPTVSTYQPMEDGKYVRNTAYLFSADGNTYYVVNAYGEVVNEIYRGGAYVTLEEVAAYVFAFGEPPANHSSSKSTNPTSSPWGIYLRVNHSNFSGSTSKYPYEPELPNISGCGGDLYYYEMDIGTTGTDCDPSYPVTDYNNGTRIERGAARIVYTRFDLDRDGVIEVGETYLFYTYNHYNDFQEYLNYEGGWGQMFGNITGGGTLSSKYDCNPTPYPETAYAAFVTTESYSVMIVALLPNREEV